MQHQKMSDNKPPVHAISLISNLLLAVGVVISAVVLVKAYVFTPDLPAGACPLTLNRPWLYLSIALLLLSHVLSFFEPGKRKDGIK